MAHSINQQFIHVLWPTKNLAKLITKDLESPLLAYISGILKKNGNFLSTGSATSNHIHLLIHLSTDQPLSDLIREVKASSSRWLTSKNKNKNLSQSFQWSEGYSAFTVSLSSINAVKNYFSNDTHRHEEQLLSYEDELSNFLKIHDLEHEVKNPHFLTTTTYTRLIYHLVWSVKNREPFLEKSDQEAIYSCLHETACKQNVHLHAIGGIADHIHILVECPQTLAIANLAQTFKTSSTHAIKSKKVLNHHKKNVDTI